MGPRAGGGGGGGAAAGLREKAGFSPGDGDGERELTLPASRFWMEVAIRASEEQMEARGGWRRGSTKSLSQKVGELAYGKWGAHSSDVPDGEFKAKGARLMVRFPPPPPRDAGRPACGKRTASVCHPCWGVLSGGRW